MIGVLLEIELVSLIESDGACLWITGVISLFLPELNFNSCGLITFGGVFLWLGIVGVFIISLVLIY